MYIVSSWKFEQIPLIKSKLLVIIKSWWRFSHHTFNTPHYMQINAMQSQYIPINLNHPKHPH